MANRARKKSLQRRCNLFPQTAFKSNPRLSIVYVDTANLKLNPGNPRLHSEKQLKQIAKSIQAFGFNVPVLVDRDRRVIAGHGRVLACKELGIEEVPTINLQHLTEAQAKAFIIADNRLAENSLWDDHLLAEQLKALSEVELDFSLDATGFELGEIDLRIEGIASAAAGERDPADALPKTEKGVQVSRAGDLWLLGRHRLYCGNALKQDSYAALMDGQRAVMIFANLAIPRKANPIAASEMIDAELTDFLVQTCSLLAAHSTQGSVHYLCIEWPNTAQVLTAGTQVYSEFKDLCVWVKDGSRRGSLYRNQHRLLFVFQNGQDAHQKKVRLGRGRDRSNVWHYPAANSLSRSTDNALSLTTTPVALVVDAILDCSPQGDIVLDPFVASGTTLIAAERTGRICYGIESDPVNADIAIRRWQAFAQKSATHSSLQCSFSALEQGGRR